MVAQEELNRFELWLRRVEVVAFACEGHDFLESLERSLAFFDELLQHQRLWFRSLCFY